MAAGQAKMLPLLDPAQASSMPAVPWSLAGVTDGGRQVNMVITYGGATEPAGVQVAGTPAAVTLTVRSRNYPPGTAFRAYQRTALFGVRLPAPLGSRQLCGFSGRARWPPRIVYGQPGPAGSPS